MFSSKPSDRGEDDGLMQNFRMNKAESDQMLLIDLSFTVQDYEMVVQNSEYPIKDFNKIKAYKHQTHCQEINLFSRMMTDRSLLTTNFKQFVSMANDIFDSYYNKLKQDQAVVMTKFSILMAEIYQELGRHEEAA